MALHFLRDISAHENGQCLACTKATDITAPVNTNDDLPTGPCEQEDRARAIAAKFLEVSGVVETQKMDRFVSHSND